MAIAVLTLKEAFRSRLILSLALAVALSVVLVPLTIKSDGTAEGLVRISLQYSLTIVSWLLALGTVWAACRTAALDIEERQIHLVVTKPVGRAQIWLGKWIGVLIMDAALLAGAGLLDYAVVRHVTRAKSGDAGDILATRRVILPQQWKGTPIVVQPGESREWRFNLPVNLPVNQPFMVRFAVKSPRQLEMKPLALRWLSPGRLSPFAHESSIQAAGFHSFPMPVNTIPDDGTLVLTCVNAQTEPPAVITFAGADSLAVLVDAGTFERNMLRAVLVLFCKLAPLAALGVTAGCLLSMPVATFAACAVVVFAMFGGFIKMAATDPDVTAYRPIPTFAKFDSLFRAQFRAFDAVVSPLRQFDALDLLPRGELVPWKMVGRAFMVLVVAYSGIPAIAGILLFRRRELGLPQE